MATMEASKRIRQDVRSSDAQMVVNEVLAYAQSPEPHRAETMIAGARRAAENAGYNGWSNYETWSVALVIDNDQRTYSESREIVRDAIQNGEPSEYWTEEDRKRFRVADALKDWVERSLEISTEPTEAEPMSFLVSQLVSAALSDVNWTEIAENYIEEVQNESK